MWPSCKHPRTKSNTTKSGYPQCRECKREDARRARRRAKEARELVKLERSRVSKGSAYAKKMAEAKREYEALLAREADRGKGGRPKGSGRGGKRTIHVPTSTWGKPNRFPNVHEDPADALLNALGTYQGAA